MYLNRSEKFISSNNIVCIDVIWFQDVGIVICQDTLTKEYKSYIKSITSERVKAPNLKGQGLTDEDRDVAYIMAYGAKFPLESAKALFPQYDFIEGDFFEEIVKKYPEYFILFIFFINIINDTVGDII